jgi:hypothetical protein
MWLVAGFVTLILEYCARLMELAVDIILGLESFGFPRPLRRRFSRANFVKICRMYLCTCERVAGKGDFGSCFGSSSSASKMGPLSIYSAGHGWRYI